jgi:putative flippase GtrA
MIIQHTRVLLSEKPPLIRYLIVGGSTFVMDLGLLVLLHGAVKLDLAVATTLAYWVSLTYNFLLNRHWVFNAQQVQSLRKHALLYGCLLTANYLATVVAITILTRYVPYEVAKSIIVVVSISWMYPIQRQYIFSGNRHVAGGHLASVEPHL